MKALQNFVCIAGLVLIFTAPALGQAMTIDWNHCVQPDRSSAGYKKDLQTKMDLFVLEAHKANPGRHVAVALNKYYGEVVRMRRDHVVASYIPVGPRRKADVCAVSDANYRSLLLVRDASYYIFCRAEVAVGQSLAARALKTPEAVAYAAIYDLLKTIGVEMRAKQNEPTTPPGGFSACAAGVVDGTKDVFPTDQEVQLFSSRLNVPDSEKQRIGYPEKQ